jgi:putative flippase GtrA
VGLSNTGISYVTYAALVYLSVHYILASIIAFAVSVLNSFFWNSKFVFKKTGDEKRNTGKTLLRTFIAYGSTGLILSNVLLFVLVDVAGISKYLAPLFILLVTVPLNFGLNKWWAFKEK